MCSVWTEPQWLCTIDVLSVCTVCVDSVWHFARVCFVDHMLMLSLPLSVWFLMSVGSVPAPFLGFIAPPVPVAGSLAGETRIYRVVSSFRHILIAA